MKDKKPESSNSPPENPRKLRYYGQVSMKARGAKQLVGGGSLDKKTQKKIFSFLKDKVTGLFGRKKRE